MATLKNNPSDRSINRVFSFLRIILGIAIVVFAALFLYWVVSYSNASHLKSEGLSTQATVGEKANDVTWQLGSIRGGLSDTRLTSLTYEVESKNYKVNSFVASPKSGDTVAVYYDAGEPMNAATETYVTEAGTQVIMSAIGFIVSMGLLVYVTVVLRRSK